MAEQEQALTTIEDKQPLNIFITAADSSLGQIITRQAVADGHHVFGATQQGSTGAFTIRDAGGIPLYPETTRGSSLRSALLMAKADVVIHLAAAVAVNSLPYIPFDYAGQLDAVQNGTQALIAAAGQTGVKRFIHVSSAALYRNDDHAAATEDSSIDASSNALFEALAGAEAAVLDGALPAVVLRAGFLYGGHTPANDALVEAIRAGRGIVTGTGTAALIHDEDLADVILALIEAELSEAPVLNVVDDTPAPIDALLQTLGQEIGVEPVQLNNFMAERRVSDLQRALLNQTTRVDNSKVKALLDWSPQYPAYPAGIEKMLLLWRVEEATAAPGTEIVQS